MRILISLLLLSITLTAAAIAATASNTSLGVNAQVLSSTGSSVRINFDLDPLERLNSTGASEALYPLVAGMRIPVSTYWIEVPSGTRPEVKVSGQRGNLRRVSGGRTVSTDGEFARVGDRLVATVNGVSAASSERFSPPSPVVIGKTVIFRGVTMAPVTVYAGQMADGGKRLIENRNIETEIEFVRDRTAPIARSVGGSGRSLRMLNGMLLNPSRDYPAASLARMLIIYPEALEDETALEQIQAFAEWKRRTGLEVILETVDYRYPADSVSGGEDIRDNIIRPLFEEEASLEYVVLMGDDRFPWASDAWEEEDHDNSYEAELFMPSFVVEFQVNDTLFYYRKLDLPYACLSGDDNMPDLAVGRFWCPTAAKLAGAIARSIAYESNPYMGENEDGEWIDNALLTIEYDAPNRPPEVPEDEWRDPPPEPYRQDLMLWARERLLETGYDEVDFIANSSDSLMGTSGQEALERGVSLAIGENWLLGVAQPPFDHRIIAETGRMNPFIINNALYYGNWTDWLLFNEVTVDDMNGCVGALTTFRYDRTDNLQFIIADAVRGIRSKGYHTSDQLYLSGMAALHELAGRDPGMLSGLDSTLEDDILDVHVFGDPSLMIMTSKPAELIVSHADVYYDGATGVMLTLSDPNETPVEGATVCLRQSGGGQYVVQSNVGGLARFAIPEGLDLGTLQITARKSGYKTFVADIAVEEGAANLSFSGFGFDDSEVGNDDGVATAGEWVALEFTIHNTGNDAASDVEVAIFSDSPHLTFSTDLLRLGDVGGGQTRSLNGDVRARIAETYSAGELLQIWLNVTCGEGEFTGAFELENVEGSRLITGGELVSTDNFNPGQQGDLIPRIRNIGLLATSPFTAELLCTDPLVELVVSERTYGAAPSDPDGGGDPVSPNAAYRVRLDPFLFRGDSVEFELRIETEDNFHQTLTFKVRVEGAEESDPLGPDEYGYICYDDLDTDWELAPRYRWRELNWDVNGYEVRGERINLGDIDVQPDELWDTTRVYALPEGFNFNYYGREVDTIAISSNGWLGTDAATVAFESPVNTAIPGFANPGGQICVLWEDFSNPFYTNCGVFAHYFEEEGLLIVEWSNIQLDNIGEADPYITSFQALLFDAVRYPTPTGDSEIIFQYERANDIPGNEAHSPYFTIGLRNLDDSDGLQYAFWHEYDERAHPIENRFAIRFTTTLDQFGVVTGRVVRDEDREAGIAGAVLRHSQFVPATADSAGNFDLRGLPVGAYEGVIVSAIGFSDDTISFNVEDGGRLNLSLPLKHPVLGEVGMYPLNFGLLSLRPDGDFAITARMTLVNDGNGAMTYSAQITDEEDERVRPELKRIVLNLQDSLFTQRVYGPVWTDTMFYAPSRRSNGQYRIEGFNKNLYQVSGFIQPRQHPGGGAISFLAFDGVNLWGGYSDRDENTYIICFTRQGQLVREFASPFHSDALSIAWNPESYSLIIGKSDDQLLYEIDTLGNVLSTVPLHIPGGSFTLSGMAWNPYDVDGMNLYAIEEETYFEGEEGFAQPWLHKLNSETGERVRIGLLIVEQANRTHRGLAIIPSDDRHETVVAIVEATTSPASATMNYYGVGPWYGCFPEAGFRDAVGVIPGNSSKTIELLITAPDWPADDYHFGIRLNTNIAAIPEILPLILTVAEDAGLDDGDGLAPVSFGITALYPNPFNSGLRVQFALDRNEKATLRLYDITGRLAATLFEGAAVAGRHDVVYDGSGLASGLYVARLESAGLSQSAKVVLLK